MPAFNLTLGRQKYIRRLLQVEENEDRERAGMIRNRWYVVLESTEVPKNKPLGARRFGEELVFWRDSQGKVSCQVDRCCHRGAKLSIGEIKGDCIECPFHGFLFDQRGQCTLIPANGETAPVPKKFRVRNYPTREAHGWIWVWYGDAEQDEGLPEIPFFDNLDDSFSYATFAQEWPVHYTRSVENQLDLMHLAFTHRKTIGRSGEKVVDGPLMEWVDEDHFVFYVFNRREDGTRAKHPKELSKESAKVWLAFRFPNIWQNYLGEKFRIFAAFVPVDDETCVTYIRHYQKFVTVPILRTLVDQLMLLLNKRILGEDRDHVVTQQPVRAELYMDEMLVPGDRPIIEYRKRRHQLLIEQGDIEDDGKAPQTSDTVE